MSAIMHITKTGHRCKNTLRLPPANYCKAGEIYEIGAWQLFYATTKKMYIVCRSNREGDYYEFSNYNCAGAKLAELGRA